MIKIVDEYRIVDWYYSMIMESLDWFYCNLFVFVLSTYIMIKIVDEYRIVDW